MPYDMSQVQVMRQLVKTAYSKGMINGWTYKCDTMPAKQVIAVYYSFKKRGLI